MQKKYDVYHPNYSFYEMTIDELNKEFVRRALPISTLYFKEVKDLEIWHNTRIGKIVIRRVK